MDDASVALFSARGRIAFGLLATAAPGVVVRMMTGTTRPTSAAVFTRMFGARDAALGLGAVIAIDHGTPVRGWLEAMALSDLADAASAVLERDHLTSNAFRGTVVIASTSALLGLYLSRRLDPHPPAHPHQPEAVVTGHHEPGGAAGEPAPA
jgi:hypothetical protein